MDNKLIIKGNFDSKIHSKKRGCDAFGILIKPPKGYRLLINNFKGHDRIQKGDLHFDIYGGWTDGHSDYYNGQLVLSEGRWKAWARKKEQK